MGWSLYISQVHVGLKIWQHKAMRKVDEHQRKMVICCWHSLANRCLVHYFCTYTRWRTSRWAHCMKCWRTLKGTLHTFVSVLRSETWRIHTVLTSNWTTKFWIWLCVYDALTRRIEKEVSLKYMGSSWEWAVCKVRLRLLTLQATHSVSLYTNVEELVSKTSCIHFGDIAITLTAKNLKQHICDHPPQKSTEVGWYMYRVYQIVNFMHPLQSNHFKGGCFLMPCSCLSRVRYRLSTKEQGKVYHPLKYQLYECFTLNCKPDTCPSRLMCSFVLDGHMYFKWFWGELEVVWQQTTFIAWQLWSSTGYERGFGKWALHVLFMSITPALLCYEALLVKLKNYSVRLCNMDNMQKFDMQHRTWYL